MSMFLRGNTFGFVKKKKRKKRKKKINDVILVDVGKNLRNVTKTTLVAYGIRQPLNNIHE